METIPNSYLYIFLSTIFLIGLISLLKSFFNLKKQYTFSIEFFNKLKTYIESEGRDNTTYTWLTRKSTKIQNDMGTFGLVDYKPAGANYIHRNHQLIVNGLSELRSYYADSYIFRRLANELEASLQEALLRYSGHLEDISEISSNSLKNPIIWFREGMQIILSIPIQLFGWLGIFQMNTVYNITTNVIFKIITGITAIITFLATVMSLVIGWDEFIKVITTLLK